MRPSQPSPADHRQYCGARSNPSAVRGGSGLARNLMRSAVAAMVDRIWRENSLPSGNSAPFEAGAAGLSLFDEILKLTPHNDRQRSLQTRAISTLQEVAKTRLLLFTEAGASIPMPFLVVLIFWLAIIFASFSLFANNNATTIVALCIFAFSASAAIFLILELGEPFTGLMRIEASHYVTRSLPSAPNWGLRFMDENSAATRRELASFAQRMTRELGPTRFHQCRHALPARRLSES